MEQKDIIGLEDYSVNNFFYIEDPNAGMKVLCQCYGKDFLLFSIFTKAPIRAWRFSDYFNKVRTKEEFSKLFMFEREWRAK